MCRELEEDRTDSVMYYRRHNGELILGPTSMGFNDPEYLAQREGHPFAAPHQIRKKFYQMLLRQVARAGLKVEYSQRVERYFEDEAAGLGGVVTEDGSIRVAHIVVAADANRTRSDLLIAGEHMPSQSSGMSVYRTALPTELALRNEAFRKRWGDAVAKEASHEFWIGPGMHLGLMVSPEFVAWGLTPRDSSMHAGGVEPVESWDPDVDPEEVVKVLLRVPDWDPAIEGLIRATPKGSIVHWPLLWRNLRREWTSKGGRVVQVGDAAHTTIPSSASGATLAIEDAVTLATCLQLACHSSGASGAPLGAWVYNLLRHDRVSCSQKLSFVNSDILGAANMDEVKIDPEKVRVRFPRWLFQHDPEAYVYEKYGQAFAHLVSGDKFQNTNLPPGHKFRPWTIEQIREDARNGESAADFLDGDWS
jgi:2-polyprenyl-6-methoxyphenol hydroxylase-like FAD-dependent oxidoreductase